MGGMSFVHCIDACCKKLPVFAYTTTMNNTRSLQVLFGGAIDSAVHVRQRFFALLWLAAAGSTLLTRVVRPSRLEPMLSYHYQWAT